ncbi:hypothetical protein MTO96_011883 [Rhipicephalus appendiculatus]
MRLLLGRILISDSKRPKLATLPSWNRASCKEGAVWPHFDSGLFCLSLTESCLLFLPFSAPALTFGTHRPGGCLAPLFAPQELSISERVSFLFGRLALTFPLVASGESAALGRNDTARRGRPNLGAKTFSVRARRLLGRRHSLRPHIAPALVEPPGR